MNITDEQLESIIEHVILVSVFDVEPDLQRLLVRAKMDAYKILSGRLEPKQYNEELRKETGIKRDSILSPLFESFKNDINQ